MPSAAAKAKRKDLRALISSSEPASRPAATEQELKVQLAALDLEQQELDVRRKEVLAQLTARDNRSGSNAATRGNAACRSERCVGEHSSGAFRDSRDISSRDAAASRPTGANHRANQTDKGANHSESNSKLATHDQQTTAAIVFPPSDVTHPDNQAVMQKAVKELLHLLGLDEAPASGTPARRMFELQLVATMKRIIKNQKQRLYRRAKKKGMLPVTAAESK